MYTRKGKNILSYSKFYIITPLVLIFLITLFFCLSSQNTKKCSLHPVVTSTLNELSIQNCSIKQTADYSNISYSITTPKVTDKEINQQIELIKSEYNLDYITEDFIQNTLHIKSENEFHVTIQQQLLIDKKISSIMTARELVLKQLFTKFEFDLDTKEVANYSLSIVHSYENEAILYNMSLEEYSENILKIPYDDFFNMCYQEGEHFIKTYLVIGAIAYDISSPTEINSNSNYEDIENRVYSYFIKADNEF